MWSEKRKNGNVTYIERYKDPLTGRVKTASVTIKPTGRKSDAKLAENALMYSNLYAVNPQTCMFQGFYIPPSPAKTCYFANQMLTS